MRERSARFEIERPLRYRARTAEGPVEGVGRTLNISKRGLLFEPDRPIEPGTKVDIEVRMSEGDGASPPILLRVEGVTVRKQDGAAAVLVRKRKLRPARSAAPAS